MIPIGMAAKKKSTPQAGSRPTKAAKKAAGSAKDKAAAPRSMPKAGKDPHGGLTAAGRRYYNKKEGSHLRPGVQGPADTPEKMVRKGSFLRRHFAHPRGPMKNEKGEPTRLALSAHAWGEPVPQSKGDAKRLAREGHELLEQYHAAKEGRGTVARRAPVAGRKPSAKKTVTRPARKRVAAKRGAAKQAPAGLPAKATKKAVPKKTATANKATAKHAAAKKTIAKRAPAKPVDRSRQTERSRRSSRAGTR